MQKVLKTTTTTTTTTTTIIIIIITVIKLAYAIIEVHSVIHYLNL